MFPAHISALQHLRDNKQIRFKTEVVDGQEFTIVSYMVASDELWQLPLAKECRGITFDSHGNCVCAPFEKFFNVGENGFTRVEDLPVTDDYIVLDKRDGSMVTPVLVNGRVVFKTKNSFSSDVARLCNEFVANNPNYTRLALHYLQHGWTPIFEFTHPNAKIVIDYGQPSLTLLAVRDQHTGKYVKLSMIREICEFFRCHVVQQWDLTIDHILAHGKHFTEVEGWVIWYPSHGLRVKYKTQWYLDRHHASTNLRERDVAEMVANETVDDLKSYLSSINYSLDPILEIERLVVLEFTTMREVIESKVEPDRGLTRKEFAIKWQGHPLFGLMMSAYLGMEPNYKRFWSKEYLPNYTLDSVYGFGCE